MFIRCYRDTQSHHGIQHPNVNTFFIAALNCFIRLGKNEQLKSFTVPADSAVNFAFQLVNSAKVLQKNVVLQCDDVFSYYEFTCSDSGSCEAKIVPDHEMGLILIIVRRRERPLVMGQRSVTELCC